MLLTLPVFWCLGDKPGTFESSEYTPCVRARAVRWRAARDGADLPIPARRALPVGTVQEVKRRPTRGDHCGAVGPANVDYHGHIHPVALLLNRAFRPDDVDMPLWLLRCAFGPHRPCAAMI